MTTTAPKLGWGLLVAAATVAGALGTNLLTDTREELATQRQVNNAQNERLARLEEQMTYLRADLQDIKASQQQILKAVSR